MANSVTDETVVGDPEFANLLEELTQRLQSNGGVDLEEYLERFPQYADQLEQLVPAMQTLIGLRNEADDSASGQPASRTSLPLGSAGGTLGDFRIIREIGRGGMGVVYEAEQLSLDRTVALKVLPFAAILDETRLTRFRNEARAAATLEHPHIVPVYSVGCERGVHFYVMRLIEGKSLVEFITELRIIKGEPSDESRKHSQTASQLTRNLSIGSFAPPLVSKPIHAGMNVDSGAAPNDAATVETKRTLQGVVSTVHTNHKHEYFRSVASLVSQAAEALHHSHERGVWHRDIKPSNLLVDYQGSLWVTDFGLARIENDANVTATGDLIGTLRYMSPEQALSKRGVVDHRTDIYSLGATFYELLTLRPVFDGADRGEVLRQIAFEEPLRLRRVDNSIPVDLETICLKMLEKNPVDRYETADDLVEDLQRYLAHQSIRAKRPSLTDVATKWAFRHSGVVLSTIVLLTTMLVASVVGATLVWREQQRTVQALVEAGKSRVLASEQADIAEQAVAESKAALDFMVVDFLGALYPHATNQSAGRLEEAPPLYEKALRLVESNLGPEHHGTLNLMGNLAHAYQSAGRLEDALPLYEKALRLMKSNLGPEHSDTMRNMGNLASAYQSAGRLEDALLLFEETLRLMKSNLGPEHSDSLITMGMLAGAYRATERLEEALPLYEKTLRLMKSSLGPEHPETLITMGNLAYAYQSAGRLEEALPLYEETLRLMKSNLGPEHPKTLNLMGNLAYAYQSAGRLEEALPLYEETLRLMKSNLGPEHPETLITMGYLAYAYQLAGRLEEALPLFEETLRLKKSNLGPEHRETLITMGNLAGAYQSAGRLEEALPLFEETLRLRKSNLGPEHRETLIAMFNLAYAYHSAGRLDEALPLFEEVIEVQTAKLGREHPQVLGSMATLGRVLVEVRDFAEAESILRNCLSLRKKIQPEAWSTFSAQGWLGAALLGQNKYAEAQPLLLSGYEGMKLREASIPYIAKSNLIDVLQSLVQVFETTGNTSEATKWKAELAARLAIDQARNQDDDPAAGDAMPDSQEPESKAPE